MGAGKWGMNHIRTLDELGALGGVVDIDTVRLDIIRAAYPKVKTFTEIEAAIAAGFDGFTVVTSPVEHYAIGKAILEAEYPVLIEKPIALKIEHAEELFNLAERKIVSLMVGHLLLFHPAIRKIKDLISGGRIGKLQYIYSNRLNLGQVRTQENVFWSLAPHDVSIFQYFVDSFPEKIKAQGSTFLQKGIHDSTITQLKYPNGVEGHIFVSWLHPFKEHRLVVIGSEAMITFEDSTDGKPLKLYSKKFEMADGVPEKFDGPVSLIDYEQKMPLTEELQYFVNHLDEKKPVIANGKHALDVIRILTEASSQLEKT